MGRNAKTIFIHLESTGVDPETGKKTRYRYTTKKNPRSENTAGKMELMKYDPVLRKHVLFKERKVSKG